MCTRPPGDTLLAFSQLTVMMLTLVVILIFMFMFTVQEDVIHHSVSLSDCNIERMGDAWDL